MLGFLLQPAHLIFLFIVVLFLFGGKLFANLGRGFASAVQNFKRSVNPRDKF